MRQRKLTWIVIVAASAFLGVILTQSFWVIKAIRFQKVQLANQTTLALKGFVNRLYDIEGLEDFKSRSFCSDSALASFEIFYNPTMAYMLDSILREEVSVCGLPQDYEYLLFTQNKQVLYGRVISDTAQVLASPFVVPVTCMHREGGILLAIRFIHNNRLIFKQLGGWILLSVLFIIMMLVAFYRVFNLYYSHKRLTELKSDFISNMTHELKTPIATISLSSEMLMKPGVYDNPEKVRKYAALIFSENDRLKRQVEDVLQVTTFEQGHLTLNKEKMDIDEILSYLREIFQVYAEEKGGTFITRKLTSATHISADRQHFINLISNLIDNAIKYSGDKPQVRLEVKNYRLDVKEGLVFIVEDNGPGIPHRYHESLFDKFYRIPTGDRHDVKGHGLGLYYVKTIALAHGFKVWFRSQEKKGSSFFVFVPFDNDKNPEKI
ncbi:MAG: sensor histidine kinase [Bacteroidales bacterium]